MLVTVAEDTNAAKVDRFGGLKLTAVEREGYSQEKKESHAWLEEKEGESSKEKKEEEKESIAVPKELQCGFCSELLEAAILLPCCVAAACDECARNSLIEQDHVCKLCEEADISPNDLIPNPLLRKKVAAFRGSTGGQVKKSEVRAPLAPLPSTVLPAETMLKLQKEQEEAKKKEDEVKLEQKRLEEALLAKLMSSENEESAEASIEQETADLAEDESLAATAEEPQKEAGDKSESPQPESEEAPSSPPPGPASSPPGEPDSSTVGTETAGEPAAPEESGKDTSGTSYSIPSMAAAVPGGSMPGYVATVPFYPSLYDYSQPPPGYPAATIYTNFPPYGQYDGWGREDRRRRRSRSRERDRYSRDRERDMDRDRLGYNWEHHHRKHGGMRRSRTEWRDGRDRSGERRGPRSRSRSRGRRSRERRKSRSRERRERSSRSMERSSKTPDPRFGEMERFDRFEGMTEEEKAAMVRARAEAELLASTEPQAKEPTVDKKEEARQKLKDLISKNKERTKEVKEKDKKPKKEKDVKEKKEKDKKSKKHKSKREGEDEKPDKKEREQKRAEREAEKEGEGSKPAEEERPKSTEPRSEEERKVRRTRSVSPPLDDFAFKEEEAGSASPEIDIGLNFDNEEGRSSRGSRSSRPGSRSGPVTSFLDDIGDKFETEAEEDLLGDKNMEDRRVYLQPDKDPAEVEVDSKVEDETGTPKKFQDETTKNNTPLAAEKGSEESFETISSRSILDSCTSEEGKENSKVDASSKEHEAEFAETENEEQSFEKDEQGKEDNEVKTEIAPDGSKRHKWNDLGRRSDEFELHLDINDSEFVDTVKAEYRSSSPSWAADSKKFKFPGGGEEKAVSVRKRMEDEIKKEDVDVPTKAEKVKSRRKSGEEEKAAEAQLKIRGNDAGLWKERPYRRSSKDDLVEVFERERREGSSASEGERERRESRQRERDRKDRERNNRMREEEEERKRRAKLEDARESNEKWARKRRDDEHSEMRAAKKEREAKGKKKLDERKLAEEEEESRRRKRDEEDLMRRQIMLQEEKKKLDAEKRAIIERKRASDERRIREQEDIEKESRKRNRTAIGESSGSNKKVIGDLRSQLDKKKEKGATSRKSKSKSKKRKRKESSSSSDSSSESDNSSDSESDSDSDIALKVFQDKKMLKKLLEAVAKKSSKKKKSKSKKKKKSVKKAVSEQRRVVLAREGGSITMQLSNTSQEEEDDEMEAELAKYNRKANKILKRSSTDEESEKKMKLNVEKEDEGDDDADSERIEINIRNSPAFKRMKEKTKKKQKKKKDNSSSDEG